MIDPKNEELMTIKEASKLPELRRNGRPAHYCSLWRWIGAGKLESLKIGGVTMVSREAVARMIQAANPGTIATVTPGERKKQVIAAEHRLALAGV